MLQEISYRGGRIVGPVLLHFLILNIVQMIRLHGDAAFLTTMAAVIVLPLFVKMMKSDGRWEGPAEGWRQALPSPGKISLIILGALFCNLVLTAIVDQIAAGFHLSNTVQEGLFAGNPVILLAGIGLIVPIEEEVLFRGLVYNRLRDYNRTWLSVFFTSLLFAGYHGNLIQILFAFPMSLIITALYEKERMLWAPVLFHMTVNLSSVVITMMS